MHTCLDILTTPMPPANRRALIATREPVIAALLGLLVESTGFAVTFPGPDEEIGEAFTRLRPIAVTIMGIELGETQSDLFFAQAAKSETRVVVFGPQGRLREIGAVAAARGIPWFTLPPSGDRIQVLMQALVERRAPRTDRRQEPESRLEGDGTQIFVDRGGIEWIVYDRRSSSERRTDESAVVDRVFVSELGESFSCSLAPQSAGDSHPGTLEQQLDTAIGQRRR